MVTIQVMGEIYRVHTIFINTAAEEINFATSWCISWVICAIFWL